MKRKLILSIGFAIIALTCITFIILLIRDFGNEEIDPIGQKIIIPIYFFFAFPIILQELSLLRSVYKLIAFNPRRSAKICYVISAVIISVALIFGLLVFTKVITYHILPERPSAESSRFAGLLLLTEWSAVIVSFALGSVSCDK